MTRQCSSGVLSNVSSSHEVGRLVTAAPLMVLSLDKTAALHSEDLRGGRVAGGVGVLTPAHARRSRRFLAAPQPDMLRSPVVPPPFFSVSLHSVKLSSSLGSGSRLHAGAAFTSE